MYVCGGTAACSSNVTIKGCTDVLEAAACLHSGSDEPNVLIMVFPDCKTSFAKVTAIPDLHVNLFLSSHNNPHF